MNWARRVGVEQSKLDMLAEAGQEHEWRRTTTSGSAGYRPNPSAWGTDAGWMMPSSKARVHFNDEELAALLYSVGLTNLWNRIDVAVELPADSNPGSRRIGPNDTLVSGCDPRMICHPSC